MTKRCVILCSGPSVNKLDLTKIDCDVIGTNSSFLAMQADIHVFTAAKLVYGLGAKLAEKHTPDAKQRFCTVELIGCFTPKRLARYHGKEYYKMYLIPRLPSNYNIFEHGWIASGASACALEIAVSYGYKEVIFCGLDLNINLGDHFYPDTALSNTTDINPVMDSTGKNKMAFKYQIEFFRQFEIELIDRGIKVYNTSMQSNETIFEKREFDSLF